MGLKEGKAAALSRRSGFGGIEVQGNYPSSQR
jgi:hypothetical protein